MAELREVVLARMRVAATVHVSRHLAQDSLRLDAIADQLYGDLLVRLETEVLGETLTRHEVDLPYGVPASWWQQLKAEHAPAWWLERWPVRYATKYLHLKFDEIATFPSSPIRTPPDKRGPLVIPYYWRDYGG